MVITTSRGLIKLAYVSELTQTEKKNDILHPLSFFQLFTTCQEEVNLKIRPYNSQFYIGVQKRSFKKRATSWILRRDNVHGEGAKKSFMYQVKHGSYD